MAAGEEKQALFSCWESGVGNDGKVYAQVLILEKRPQRQRPSVDDPEIAKNDVNIQEKVVLSRERRRRYYFMQMSVLPGRVVVIGSCWAR